MRNNPANAAVGKAMAKPQGANKTLANAQAQQRALLLRLYSAGTMPPLPFFYGMVPYRQASKNARMLAHILAHIATAPRHAKALANHALPLATALAKTTTALAKAKTLANKASLAKAQARANYARAVRTAHTGP